MKMKSISLILGILSGVAATAAEEAAPDPLNTPLKILQTHRIVFPERMLKEGVLRGEARIAFHIDSKGTLVDAMAVAYTAKPFAENALEALRRWKYTPPRTNGKPGSSVVHLSVRFETDTLIAIERTQPPSLDVNERVLSGEFVYQPCPPKELDRPLKTVAMVPPDYPGALRGQGVEGAVQVNFYIDETGKTRMVVASSDAHPILASLAIAAVEQWRFEPPTSKGRPVLLNVVQEFKFSSKDDSA